MRAAFSEVVEEGIEKFFQSDRKQQTAVRSKMKQKAKNEETIKNGNLPKIIQMWNTAKKYKVPKSTIRLFETNFQNPNRK